MVEMYKATADASALNSGGDEIEHRIQLTDGLLACLELGDSRGVPVFYCHGFPGSRFEARLAAGAARRLGIRVLAPDRPGLGASTYLTGCTIGDWAADVTELADRMALERFALLGVSGGGPYALACAARILQRVRAVAVVAGMAPTRAIGRHTRGTLVRIALPRCWRRAHRGSRRGRSQPRRQWCAAIRSATFGSWGRERRRRTGRCWRTLRTGP